VWPRVTSWPSSAASPTASWRALRSGSSAFRHGRVCGSRRLVRWLFGEAIVERHNPVTGALDHVRKRAPAAAPQRIVHAGLRGTRRADPSITRARAVTALRMLLRARGSRSSWYLRRPPLNRSCTCERRTPIRPHRADPMCIVAPSPSANQPDWHVRREAPNTASPPSNMRVPDPWDYKA
jgi:hypothetical protein